MTDRCSGDDKQEEENRKLGACGHNVPSHQGDVPIVLLYHSPIGGSPTTTSHSPSGMDN